MTTAAQNGGRMDAYRRAQKMGIKLKHRWLATLDGHTRESHREVDGEIVEVGEKFSNGLEYPGDPNGAPGEIYNCRCVDIAAFDDSEFDGDKGRFSRLPDDMTYDEWKEAKGGEPFFKAARNVNRNMDMHNEYTDLYRQHKEAFTQAVPKNFNDFQDLKYKNTDAWKQMVSDARTARLYDKNPQLYSQKIAAKSVDIGSGSGIINLETSNGIKITNLSKHVQERMKERTLLESEIKDALINPLHIDDIKARKDGNRSQRFIGNQATVNVNPDTGNVITAWKTGKDKLKKYRKSDENE